MNLHHLRIFYTVAQHRSVTAAAGELLLSQPAVSLQLKDPLPVRPARSGAARGVRPPRGPTKADGSAAPRKGVPS
jgi:hypothetical protein